MDPLLSDKNLQGSLPLSNLARLSHHYHFPYLLPFGLYFKGIERIRATRAGITSTLETGVAGITAYLVLGEALHPFQVLGGIGVIAAVVLLQISREKSAPSSPMDIRQKG